MKVSEYAASHGLTVQRVAQLARAGRLPARKERGRWIIEYEGHVPATRKPLSATSQADLLGYFAAHNMNHVTGYRRRRLAERIRALRASGDEGARLLREWFAGSNPQGPGGAALVRTAQIGQDRFANNALRGYLAPPSYLVTAADVATAVRDERLIRGLSAAEVAAEAGFDEAAFRTLERHGVVPGGNVTARKLFSALGYQPAALKVRGAK